MDLYTIALCVLLPAYFVYKLYRRPSNFPPGPYGLPLLGVAAQYKKNPGKLCKEWSKKYGPVMSIRMGLNDWVVLNDYDSIHEAIVVKREQISGRPQNCFLDILTQHKHGIGFVDYGDFYKQQRNIASAAMASVNFDNHIDDELPHILEHLAEKEGTPFDITDVLSHAAVHCMCGFMLGERLGGNDERFLKLHEYFRKTIADEMVSSLMGAAMTFPFLFKLPYFSRRAKIQQEEMSRVIDVFHGFIDDYKRQGSKKEENSFLGLLLDQLDTLENNTDVKRQASQVCYDCYFAGIQPMLQVFRWSVIVLIRHQEAQERLRKEIGRVYGSKCSSVLGLAPNKESSYIDAFIQELLRFRTVVPGSVPHKTTDDVNLCGYRIPKDTVVIPNLWGVHNDPELWKDPEKFKPERHLTDDGSFVKSDKVIPNSIGPRSCLGERVFRNMFRTFVLTITSEFRIEADPQSGLPNMDSGITSAVFHADPFQCIVTRV